MTFYQLIEIQTSEKKEGKTKGLASLCIGGEATAVTLELVKPDSYFVIPACDKVNCV